MLWRFARMIVLICMAVVFPVQASVAQEDKWRLEDLLELLGPSKGVVRPVPPIGYDEELAIGDAITLEVFKRYGIPQDDDVLRRYLNLLGSAVARNSDRPDLPYRFALLDTDEVSAFATPGGYIFVTMGLLSHVRNEAELAGVLGHEITHVSQKHLLRDIEGKRRYRDIEQITMALFDQEPQFFEGLIDTTSDTLFDSGLAWEDEFDCDRLGTEFARRAGYDPYGLRDFLITLRAIKGHKDSIFFRTHPSPDKRLEQLDYFIQKHYPAEQRLAQAARRYRNTVLARVGSSPTTELPAAAAETKVAVLSPQERAARAELAREFVGHLYRSILEREPDPSGLTSYTETLVTETTSPEQMFLEFFKSQEYLQKKHNSAAFLSAAYRAVLRREPDPAGQSTFLPRLESGAMSRDEVLRALVNSQEYLAKRLW